MISALPISVHDFKYRNMLQFYEIWQNDVVLFIVIKKSVDFCYWHFLIGVL